MCVAVSPGPSFGSCLLRMRTSTSPALVQSHEQEVGFEQDLRSILEWKYSLYRHLPLLCQIPSQVLGRIVDKTDKSLPSRGLHFRVGRRQEAGHIINM